LRLAQQISKFERIFEDTGVSVGYKILDVYRKTKDAMKVIETSRILRHAEKMGIPIGNKSHIRANVGKLIRNISARALKIMSKYFKL